MENYEQPLPSEVGELSADPFAENVYNQGKQDSYINVDVKER